MRNLIIGSGVVGESLGKFLLANSHDALFCDVNMSLIEELKNKGYNTTKTYDIKGIDIIWICTHENKVESVVQDLAPMLKEQILIIKSTTPPGTTAYLKFKYHIRLIGHNPEFLRQGCKVEDTFNPDRVVIGSSNKIVTTALLLVYDSLSCPKIVTSTTSSEMIKYVSNCWLATQISYWNEIRDLCIKLKINPQLVANGATLDKRISKYGTIMTGEQYSGRCLPKDMNALIDTFSRHGVQSIILSAVKEVNNKRRENDIKE